MRTNIDARLRPKDSLLNRRWVRYLVLATLLLLIFAVRVTLLDGRSFDSDEVRLLTRAEGTPLEVIQWQPVDWPPLFNLAVSFWKQGISDVPDMLRLQTVLWSMVAAAALYRAGQAFFGSVWAGVVTMLAFAALRYQIDMSVYLRGYGMASALLALTFWLTLRYFQRPTWQSGAVLALVIALCFLTTYTAFFAFGVLGLLTLLRYGRAIWRWAYPIALSTVLVLPELLFKLERLQTRLGGAGEADIKQVESLAAGISRLWTQLVGAPAMIWVVVAVAALASLLLRERRAQVWALVIVVGLTPVLLYGLVGQGIILDYNERYVWWSVILMALVLAAASLHLPHWSRGAVLVLLLVLMGINTQQYTQRPLYHHYQETFEWLRQRVQPGDVLFVDSAFCTGVCGHQSMVLTYHHQTYLGDLAPIVADPTGYQRVWYLHSVGRFDSDDQAQVLDGRLGAEFYGPAYFLLQRFTAPPDPVGVRFGAGLRFHGLEVLDEQGRSEPHTVQAIEGRSLRLRLWWSLDQRLPRDYSVSLQLQANGAVIAQADGPVQVQHLQPSNPDPLPGDSNGWQLGQLYTEERVLTIPQRDDSTPAQLYLTVYQWWDGVRLAADGTDANDQLPLTRPSVFVWGW